MKLKSCTLLHWPISIFHLWEPLVVFWKTMVRKQYQNLKRFTHRSTLGWGGYWEWEWEKDLLCFHKTAVPKPLFLWPIQVSNASNGLTGFTTLHILLKCTNTWESNRAYLFEKKFTCAPNSAFLFNIFSRRTIEYGLHGAAIPFPLYAHKK